MKKITAYILCAALLATCCVRCEKAEIFTDKFKVEETTDGYSKGGTKIHFIALPGDTDAILLESNERFGMVDSGEDVDYPDGSDPSYPFRAGITTNRGWEEQVIAYMKAAGVTQENFEFYIGTHAHSDHIGSADEIIREFKPDRVYLMEYKDSYISNPNGLWDNKYVYDNTVKAALETGAVLIQALDPKLKENTYKTDDNVADTSIIKGSTSLSLGEMKLEIFNYEGIWKEGGQVWDANSMSLCIKITACGHTAFLGGDLPIEEEKLIAPQIGDVDLVKINHHGKDTSSSYEFFASMRPEISVVTGAEIRLVEQRLNEVIPDSAGIINKIYSTDWYKDLNTAIVFSMSDLKASMNRFN